MLHRKNIRQRVDIIYDSGNSVTQQTTIYDTNSSHYHANLDSILDSIQVRHFKAIDTSLEANPIVYSSLIKALQISRSLSELPET